MKKFLFLMFLCTNILQAQEHAWVYFKDKPDAQTYLNTPISMLTQRALDRRIRQNIAVTIQDVPVDDNYVLAVKNSDGIILKTRSKWLNAVHVLGSQTAITNLKNLVSVDSIQFANKNLSVVHATNSPSSKIAKRNKFSTVWDDVYGDATNQTNMLGVEEFHKIGFKGQGMQIAIMDAGFYGVDKAEAFGHLLDNDESNGEILGGYDFVNSSTDLYKDTGTAHGTNVLSTIAAIKENEFVGTAPEASFYLFVTEDAANESPLEESLWVQAAERADSLGVDIINTSLGYNEFDESKYNYNYADMDGATTFITRGANIAAQKGMVLVNSIGNSGNDSWKYLTAPSDAKNIIAVGAVNEDSIISSFSSYGPSADSRIKPETLAQGGNVKIVDFDNIVKTSNGTSFSGPIIAGVVTCLWQANPTKTSLEIREMVIQNSELYQNPTGQEGYGILNVSTLAPALSVDFYEESPFYIHYDFSNKIIQVQFHKPQTEDLIIQMFSFTGAVLENKVITKNDNQIDYSSYAIGIYYMRFIYMGKSRLIPLYIRD